MAGKLHFAFFFFISSAMTKAAHRLDRTMAMLIQLYRMDGTIRQSLVYSITGLDCDA